MEITIGVRDVAREITIETTLANDEVLATVKEALDGGTSLVLTDERGGQVVVPAGALGYVQIGSEEPRRVGFGV